MLLRMNFCRHKNRNHSFQKGGIEISRPALGLRFKEM